MSDEIFQLKPNFHGVGIDLKALFKRLGFGNKPTPDPVELVAQRFLQAFLDHGIAVTRIPRLVDGVSLESLRGIDELVKVLTPSVLDATANLFGIQHAWLEGATDVIYPRRHVYRDLPTFLSLLPSEKSASVRAPLRALCSSPLDYSADRHQPVALVILEQAAMLDDDVVPRFTVINDVWDWSYQPARLQAKAMARLSFKRFGPVPLYCVPDAMLESILSGEAIPHNVLAGTMITDPSLEDYVLSPTASAVAKEAEELPEVLRYLDEAACFLPSLAQHQDGSLSNRET